MTTIEQGSEAKQYLSFRELEQTEQVVPEDLLVSLEHYAAGGWAVSGDVVVSVAHRCELSKSELERLALGAIKGIDTQATNPTSASAETVAKEQDEYGKVLLHAAARYFRTQE